MELNRCPHCRNLTDRPQIFGIGAQQIFDFIIANPRCTVADIELGIYGRELDNTLVFVHLHKIKKLLLEHKAPYRIHVEPIPSVMYKHRPRKRFSVVKIEGQENAVA